MMNGKENNQLSGERKNWAVEIFARIWALWGLVTFVTTFLIIFIPSMLTYLVKGNKGQYLFILVSKYWINFWLFLIGCSFKISGVENFEPGETYVVACNHKSLLDPTITCPYIPGANKTIAKLSFAKIPIFGWFYRRGSVLVDRNDTRSRVKSFEDMMEVVRLKMHMCIYPEGTRNLTNEPLNHFYDGAFSLAVRSHVSVIPTVLSNTEKAMPANKTFYLLPCKLTLQFLPPVSSEGKNAKTLKEEVHAIMWQKIVENRAHV